MIYSGLFSMSLSRSYDLDHMFCRLTRVDWGRLLCPVFRLIFSLFNFNFQQWVCWKLNFIIYFDLLSMTHVIFLFTFYKVIMISWSGSQVWQFNSGQFFLSFFISFLFYPLTFVWFEIRLHIFLVLLSIKLSWFHYQGHNLAS